MKILEDAITRKRAELANSLHIWQCMRKAAVECKRQGCNHEWSSYMRLAKMYRKDTRHNAFRLHALLYANRATDVYPTLTK